MAKKKVVKKSKNSGKIGEQLKLPTEHIGYEPLRLTDKERDTFQLFRDKHGVVWLRASLGPKKDEAEFVVNNGKTVELVRMNSRTMGDEFKALRAIPDASIWAAAERLSKPLNDNVTISQRAKTILDRILGDEIMKTKATEKNAKPAKFTANVTAPAPKKGKTAKKTAAKKATSEGVGRRAKFEDTAKIVSKFDAKNPPYREGSARQNLLNIAAKAGTVGKYLAAAGEPTGGSPTAYLNLFVKEGHLAVS